MARYFGFLTISVLALLRGVPSASAQFSIEGRISDANGMPVNSAFIHVKAHDSDQSRTAYTNLLGRFEVRGIDAGSYDLHVVAPRFAPFTVDGIDVSSANTNAGHIKLQSGDCHCETIVVCASCPMVLDTRNARSIPRKCAWDLDSETPSCLLSISSPDPAEPVEIAASYLWYDLVEGVPALVPRNGAVISVIDSNRWNPNCETATYSNAAIPISLLAVAQKICAAAFLGEGEVLYLTEPVPPRATEITLGVGGGFKIQR